MKKKSRIILWTIVVLLLVGFLAAFNFYGTFYHNNVAALEKQPLIEIPRNYN